jgi:hypothetical protein
LATHDSDDVRRKGYGDCKGLTNYMKTLLDAAGIKSYYSVITSDETPLSFDPDFPKMGGNHVILMIPTERPYLVREYFSTNCF